MQISFGSVKLAKTCNSEKEVYRRYGKQVGRALMRRLAVLDAAESLADVPSLPPERCHPLKGERAGEFAVDLAHPFRLVFRPDHDPVPRLEDGGVDRGKVTAIRILSVEDYHR